MVVGVQAQSLLSGVVLFCKAPFTPRCPGVAGVREVLPAGRATPDARDSLQMAARRVAFPSGRCRISEQSLGSATRIARGTGSRTMDELSPRKRPRQRRSIETVDAIVEAAARVFAERGYAGGSTNRIALTAGVSIGSLYEYFPNKGSILVAVAERHLGRMIADVERLLERAQAGCEPLEPLLRRFVLAMLEVHERDPALHHVVFAEAPHPPELHECVLQSEERLAHSWLSILQQLGDARVRDADTAAHLIVQLTEALTHRFVLHGLHDLSTDVFIEEVVVLLKRYLRISE